MPDRAAMGAVTVTLLGGLDARLDSGAPLALSTRKAQALLAYLAARPGQRHSRDELARLLWADKSDGQARDGLRHALAALRRALGATTRAIRVDSQDLSVDPDGVEVDVPTFETSARADAPEALQRAARLYRGDFLLGFTLEEPLFEDWLVSERERLRRVALDALSRLLSHQTAGDSLAGATETAVRLLGLDPLQEPVHRALMQLYARQGRRGAALKQYQVCVGVLARELGADPERETKRLYQELLRVSAEESTSAAPLTPGATAPVPPDLPEPETPLCGRGAELDSLRTLLENARRGRGHVATLLGEAGIGKTRLVSALAADAVALGCRVVIGRCHESDAILPFGPWVDACRSGKLSSDEALLAGLHPRRRAELGRLLPEVTIGGLPPASDSALPLFESLTELIEHMGARQPLLLIVEDIHWADEMSLRLLAFVSRRVGTRPVLLVATARHEELADASMARRTIEDLSALSGAHSVVLAPLSRSETARLVHALAPVAGDPAALARVEAHVWATSEGNPFVAVEAIRVLERDRTLEGGCDRPGVLAVPERVRHLVSRRLDRLSARGQDVAAVAAVIGRQFDFNVLRAASGLDEREAAGAVEEMVRQHVLQAIGNQLDFTHDRVRDVAYGRLLLPRRRLLHRAVAESLERLGTPAAATEAPGPRDTLGERIEQLAHHYTEAGLAAPAAAYWQRASERSSARSAYVETVAQCRKALELLGTLPDTSERAQQEILVQTALGPALMATCGPATPDAEAAYRRALELSRRTGDAPRLFMALVGLWQFYLVRAEHRTARELAGRLLGLAEQSGDPALLVLAHRAMGEACQNRGELVMAEQHLARGSALYDSEHHRSHTFTEPGVFCLAFASWVLCPLGYPARALARSEAALALARQLAYPHTLAAVLYFAAMVHKFRGERHLARQKAEAVIAVAREHGLPHWMMFGGIVRGWAQAVEGAFEEGIGQITEGLAIQQSMGAGIGRPSFLLLLAEAYGAAGQTDAGLAALDEAAAAVERTGERFQEPDVYRLRGELLLQRSLSDASLAEDALQQSLAIARRQHARSPELRAATSLARVWQRLGKRAAAHDLLAPLYGWFTEGFDTADLAEARALLEEL